MSEQVNDNPAPLASPTPARTTTRAEWRDRIGTYALGVAIGLVMVGMIMMGRSRARAMQNAPTTPPPVPAASP